MFPTRREPASSPAPSHCTCHTQNMTEGAFKGNAVCEHDPINVLIQEIRLHIEIQSFWCKIYYLERFIQMRAGVGCFLFCLSS